MILEKKFRLRWALEYKFGRLPSRGVWDNASPHLSDSAWIKDKRDLKFAVIEAEELQTFGQYRMLECEADRFVSFNWVAAVSMPFGMTSITSSGEIVGLQIVTPENSFTVYIDGKIVKKSLTEDDKKFDLKEHNTRVI